MKPPIQMESMRLADWSGYTDFGGTADVYAPRSEGEIVDLVRYCRDSQKKLRVIGLQTSWNTLWYCSDVMMTTKYLNHILEIDAVNRTITCEAGVTLEQIHDALWEKGLTLDTAPAVDWVTIGGSISTGSHGSGPASNSSSMIGCRLVTASGTVVEIGEGDQRLDAVRISMGTLGVLSTVTLKVVDAFYISMERVRIPTHDWKRYLTEGEMSYLLWFPHTEYSVLAKCDVIRDPAEVQKRAAEASSKGFDANNPDDVERLGVDIGKPVAAIAGFANIMPSTFPARNRYLLDVLFQDIKKVGPAHEVLMSFQSAPIAGGEWSVPVGRFEAALADMQAEISKGDFYLPIVWLKKVAGESAWLSAADEECVQCGIYHHLIDGTPSHVKEMVMRIERLMLRHGGRPHLGKLIYLDPADLRRVYSKWEKFDALRRQMDPQGMFWSESLAKSFGN
jgi:L-gulonolactone oxidase